MALLDPVYRRGCAVLFVKKKDGASLVINYRELNVLRFLTAILSRESRLRHHYDPSKVKQSPNAETYYGDGSEKLSALCWLLPTFCEGFSQISFTSYPADEKDRGDGGTSDRLMTLTSVQSGKAMSCPDALSRKSRMKACFDSIILRDLERLISKEAQRDGRFNQNVQGFETVLLVEWAIKQDVATICILMETCQQDQINIRGLVDVTALAIPMWKWDEISMDFDTCFAYYTKRHDAIMGGANVSDKIRKFTSRFERISEGWGTRLKFSTSISSSKPMILNVLGSRASSVLDSSASVEIFGTYWRGGYHYHTLHVQHLSLLITDSSLICPFVRGTLNPFWIVKRSHEKQAFFCEDSLKNHPRA
ncbi:hypothetical protein Tco_1285739 [Tanacetum coccineum]